MDVRGEWSGGGERAREDSGMSWYGAKLAAIVNFSCPGEERWQVVFLFLR